MSERKNTLARQAEALARRLAGNVAMELGIAGAEVLREKFGFTPEQIAAWMAAMIERAKQNREGQRS